MYSHIIVGISAYNVCRIYPSGIRLDRIKLDEISPLLF